MPRCLLDGGRAPPEVTRSLYERLMHTEAWPRRAPFFWRFKLPRWLAAAARAGMLTELEPVLRFLAEVLEPAGEPLGALPGLCLPAPTTPRGGTAPGGVCRLDVALVLG